jgi:hypothetical protein
MGSNIDQQCCKFKASASGHEEILHQSHQMVVLERHQQMLWSISYFLDMLYGLPCWALI